MKRKFTASAIYIVMMLAMFIDPLYAITINDLPTHEINVMENGVSDEITPFNVIDESASRAILEAPMVVSEPVAIVSEYSESEISLLERLVHAESEGEPFIGKVAVANVVLNRVKSEKFPNTIKEVIYERNQFSPIRDGRIKNTPSEESKLAVKMALEGYQVIPEEVAFFYEPDTSTTNWIGENKTFYGIIANHHFFYE